MKHLLAGHAKFRADYFVNEAEFLRQLAHEGQNPSALYIGCCDSRVVPELLTSSAPGELFVVRNIANVVPPHANDPTTAASVGAAIEYAVDVLGVQHVIVCGHDRCGGVQAVIDGIGKLAAYPHLTSWLKLVEPAVSLVRASAGESRLADTVEENVLQQMEHLLTHPTIQRAVGQNKLTMHGWVYDVESGGLRVYDVTTEEFLPAERLTAK